MHSARFSILAGTALALILTASTTACAAPQNADAFVSAATDHAQLQHAGQHAEAIGDPPDDDGMHLPRLAAGTHDSHNAARAGSQRRVRTGHRARACPRRPEPLARRLRLSRSPPLQRRPPRLRSSCRARARRGCACPAPEPVVTRRRGRAGQARCGGTRRRSPRRTPQATAEVGNKIREIVTSKQFDRVVVAQARPRRHRRALSEGPQLPAALGRAGRAERARPRRARLSEDHRRRRPRSERLSDAAAQRRQRRGPGRGGAEVHRDAADLRAPRDDRPRALHPRQPEHRLQARLRRRRRAEEDRRVQRPVGRRSTQLNPPQPGYEALKAKLAELREAPEDAAARRIPDGAVLHYTRDQPRPRNGDDRSARAGAARAPRPARGAELQLQRRAGDGGRQVPEGQRHPGQRPAQRARPSRRSTAPSRAKQARCDPRHHGALALDAARPRQDPRRAQHPGLLRSRLSQRREGLADPHRGRQAGPRDAAAHRDDEVHHAEPDLERAAVDHLQRAAAALRDLRPADLRAPGPEDGARPRRQRPRVPAAGRAQRARPASASTSRTSSWSTSTTRRRRTTSTPRSAPTATAASACRTR